MENKVVVHMKNGEIHKGLTHDFDPRKETLHLLPAEGGGLPIRISLESMKALFYVKDYIGNRDFVAAREFDAGGYVEVFWNGPLLQSTHSAVDASELLEAFAVDFQGTAKQFGHRLGLSGHSSYFVSGQGVIVAVDPASVSIALHEGGPAAVTIETGPVFGNAIRDGSGLLNVSDCPNAQDFNALSAEINKRVETLVLPLLKEKAHVGVVVRFVGGVEVPDSGGAPQLLALVPVVVEFP